MAVRVVIRGRGVAAAFLAGVLLGAVAAAIVCPHLDGSGTASEVYT